jgi:hypothetical protein
MLAMLQQIWYSQCIGMYFFMYHGFDVIFFHDQCASIESLIHLIWLLAICVGTIPCDTNCVLYLLQC